MTTTKFPPLNEEIIAKYQRIAQFTIGLHTTHVQACRDLDRSWLLMCYKVTDEELEATIDDWPASWPELVSSSEVSAGPPTDASDDSVRGADQQSHHDFDGESLIETHVDLEAQCIFKEIRMKKRME